MSDHCSTHIPTIWDSLDQSTEAMFGGVDIRWCETERSSTCVNGEIMLEASLLNVITGSIQKPKYTGSTREQKSVWDYPQRTRTAIYRSEDWNRGVLGQATSTFHNEQKNNKKK